MLEQFQKILEKYKNEYKPKPGDYIFYVNKSQWERTGLTYTQWQGFEIVPHELIEENQIYFGQRINLEL